MLFSRLTAAPNHGQNRSMTSLRRSPPLLATVGFIALLTVAPTAWGQQETIYIGGAAPRGSVYVDMSVLDELGGGVGQSTLKPPAARGNSTQRVALKPPGQQTAKPAPQRVTTKPQAVTQRKPPAQTTKTAAPKPAASSVRAPSPVAALPDMPPPPPAPIDIAALPAPGPAPAPVSAPATTSTVVAAANTPTAAPRDLKPAAPPAPVAAPIATPTMVAKEQPTAVTRPPATAPTPAPISAAVAPPTTSTQTAALTPLPQPSGAAANPSTRIAFVGDGAALPESAKGDLKKIAGALGQDPGLRIQVLAYANGGDDAQKARRLSLTRALAVRSYLIEQGIGSTRIDVKPLGNAAEGGPSDRVDILMVSR